MLKKLLSGVGNSSKMAEIFLFSCFPNNPLGGFKPSAHCTVNSPALAHAFPAAGLWVPAASWVFCLLGLCLPWAGRDRPVLRLVGGQRQGRGDTGNYMSERILQ